MTSLPPEVRDSATLAEAFVATAAARAHQPALRTTDGRQQLSWQEYATAVARTAARLEQLGVRAHDTVVTQLPNSPAFHVVDAAAVQLGAVTCALYPTAPVEQAAYLVADSGCRLLVTGQAGLALARGVLERCPVPGGVAVVPGPPGERLDERPDPEPAGPPDGQWQPLDPFATSGDIADLAALARARRPDETVSLVYTSGTTGSPKGAELTHRNALAVGRAFVDRAGLPAGARMISYLPMAHIAERASSHWLPMLLGSTVTCCPDPARLPEVLREVRPEWLFGVPRVWEKLKLAIESGIAAAPEPMQAAATRGVAVGRQLMAARERGEQVPEDLAAGHQALLTEVLLPLRASAGLDQLRCAHVGAAPVARSVVEFFHALGVPLGQIWGMTELTAATCVSRPDRARPGTVGPPLDGMELRVGSGGEVLVRGPGVMAGYRNRPEDTAGTIDSEGWLHTGDVGHLDADGELTVTGRTKEIMINAYGKNMAPAMIETAVKADVPMVSQLCCFGDGRAYNVALVTLDREVAPAVPEADLVSRVVAGIAAANERLSRVEQIRRVHVLDQDWPPGGEELTASMKLRRNVVAKKYAAEIDALYQGTLGYVPSLPEG